MLIRDTPPQLCYWTPWSCYRCAVTAIMSCTLCTQGIYRRISVPPSSFVAPISFFPSLFSFEIADIFVFVLYDLLHSVSSSCAMLERALILVSSFRLELRFRRMDNSSKDDIYLRLILLKYRFFLLRIILWRLDFFFISNHDHFQSFVSVVN